MDATRIMGIIENEMKLVDMEKKACESPYPLDEYIDDKFTYSVLKDIDENHNNSWIKEIWDSCVANKRLDKTAILYRGKTFTYKDFFIESYRYAKALKFYGYEKGQEFVCAIENTPEFPFIMGAVSMIGGRVNLVSSEFDTDYLVESLERADAPFVFSSDMSFAKFYNALKFVEDRKLIIPVPIDHSLTEGNPYKELIEKVYKLDVEAYEEAKKNLKNVIDIDDFLAAGDKYEGRVIESCDLNDEFTTTYTSGSTGWGRPKGLVHRVRSYVTMGRYHDPKVSGIPSMAGRTTLAMIKTMSDTDFMSNVSDTFIQGGITALEPVNNVEFFLTSMVINKPNLAIASRCYWLYAMKEQMTNPMLKDLRLPTLYVPTAVGEPLPASEEKALNKWLYNIKAGIKVTKLPLAKMCHAGGDSEHGGIFLTIYRKYQSMLPKNFGIKEPVGMGVYKMVKMKCLHEDGTYCEPMELGRLVANSPCTMEGYVNNPVANEQFFIEDAYGNTYADLMTYGYLDKNGNAYVKGRIFKDDGKIPPFMIQEAILEDVKNYLSCEVVKVGDNLVAHIEPQINRVVDDSIFSKTTKRLKKKFGSDIADGLYYRIRSSEESFPLLHTGKRNCIALAKEGISSNCIKA